VKLAKKGAIRKYGQGTDGQLVPLEFIDQDGTRITATLFSSGIEKYNSILTEGKSYIISKGCIKIANRRYTSINHEFSLILDATSEIKLLTEDLPISEISTYISVDQATEAQYGSFVDVIGIVKFVGESCAVMMKGGLQTSKRIICLCSETGCTIPVTLWRKFATLQIQDGSIIGLAKVRVSEFNGRHLNSVNDTVIDFNPKDPKIDVLREW